MPIFVRTVALLRFIIGFCLSRLSCIFNVIEVFAVDVKVVKLLRLCEDGCKVLVELTSFYCLVEVLRTLSSVARRDRHLEFIEKLVVFIDINFLISAFAGLLGDSFVDHNLDTHRHRLHILTHIWFELNFWLCSKFSVKLGILYRLVRLFPFFLFLERL